jgi:hypothetical protein
LHSAPPLPPPIVRENLFGAEIVRDFHGADRARECEHRRPSLRGVNHLHLSFAFAAAAFVPGLFWGWLFTRHRNLVGPTLSHVVVGTYVFFVMGVPMAQKYFGGGVL